MTTNRFDEPDELLLGLMAQYDEALAADRPTVAVDESAIQSDAPLAADWEATKRCLELLDRARRQGDVESLARCSPGASAPQASIAAQRQLGRFKIERELGRGGLGIVYLAHDPQLGRKVALKIPRFEALLDDDLRRRFMREAEAAARLNHPHLVAIHDVGEDGTTCYLASEYCPGPTLSQWLSDRRASVPLGEAASIVLALAEAVEHAHSRGVLHRDIKPSNVLLSATGESESDQPFPKLTDFGMAKLLEQEGGATTREGVIIGTLAYMAPEQAEGRVDQLDARTDVYALGAILYELVTGVAPHVGPTDVDTLRQLILNEPAAPRKLRPDVPRDLEAIALQCLAKNPAKRYPTANALAVDLRRFLDGEPTAARPLRGSERLWKWAKRRPAIAALLGAGCISLAIMIVGSLWFSQRLSQLLNESQLHRARAETQARLAMEHVYASDMAAAQQAWMEGNLTGMAALLKQFEPTAEQADLRGAEWHYLRNLIDGASRVLTGHVGRLGAVAFSHDGHLLASGGQDGIVRVWNIISGKLLHTWKPPNPSEVNAVAFSPDGQRLAAATDEGLIRLWDVRSGTEQAVLRGHAGWVADVCFSADQRHSASAGSDRTVRLWDAATGKEKAVLRGHQDIVRRVRFILNGSIVASTSEDQTVRLWRTSDGAPLVTESLDLSTGRNAARPTDMAVSPDGQTLAVCVESTFVRLWRIEAPGRLERLADVPHEQVRSVAFSADGRRLLFGANDAQLYEWELDERRIAIVRRGHEQQILSLAVSPSDNEIASGSRDGQLRLWGADSGQAYRTVSRVPFRPYSSAFAQHADRWAVGSSDGEIALMDDMSGQSRRTWTAHSGTRVEALRFSSNGAQLVSRSDGHGCRIWDVENGRLLADHPKWCVPNGRVLFAADSQNMLVATGQRLQLINLASGVAEASLVFPSTFQCLAYSPDARHIAVGGHLGELWILDAHDLRVCQRLLGHSDHIVGLAFSHSGQLLCSSSDDRSTWVWDWQQGTQRKMLSGSDGGLALLKFLPDDRSVLGIATDKTIRFWNVSTGRKTLQVPVGGIAVGLRISPNGRRVYVVVADDQQGDGLLGYLPIASE